MVDQKKNGGALLTGLEGLTLHEISDIESTMLNTEQELEPF